MTDFPSIAFQASLGTEGLLFVVFGFLYTVYGTFSDKDRPTIVDKIKETCRILSIFILLNALLTIYSLILMFLSEVPSNLSNLILGSGISLTMLAIAIISLVWAFKYMG